MSDEPPQTPGTAVKRQLPDSPQAELNTMALLIAQQRFGDAAVHGCRICHRYRVSPSFVEDTLLALQHSGQHRSALEIATEILPAMPEGNRPFLRATIAILAAQLGRFEFSLEVLHQIWPDRGGFDPLVDPDIQALWDHLATDPLTEKEHGLLMSARWNQKLCERETTEQESLDVDVSAIPVVLSELGRWLVWMPAKVLWKLDEAAPDHAKRWLRGLKHEIRGRNQHILDSVRMRVLLTVSG